MRRSRVPVKPWKACSRCGVIIGLRKEYPNTTICRECRWKEMQEEGGEE